MGIGDGVHLRAHRVQHLGIAMAEAGHRRPARAVDIAPPPGIGDPDPIARDGAGQFGANITVKDAGHLGLPNRLDRCDFRFLPETGRRKAARHNSARRQGRGRFRPACFTRQISVQFCSTTASMAT